jgi:hypothetical protein
LIEGPNNGPEPTSPEQRERRDNLSANPYASPHSASQRSVTAVTGTAWGLLFGPVHGATSGVLAGVSLAVVATIFYATTRQPGWFGPAEGLLLRLTLYFMLAGIVGGVAGVVVGAFGGVVIGLASRWSNSSLSHIGIIVFVVLGGSLTALIWWQPLAESESPWKLAALAAAIAAASAYAAVAGRRTGQSIHSKLHAMSKKNNGVQ